MSNKKEVPSGGTVDYTPAPDSHFEKRWRSVLERHGLKLHRVRDEQGHREKQGVYYISEADNDTPPDEELEAYRYLSFDDVADEVARLEEKDAERDYLERTERGK